MLMFPVVTWTQLLAGTERAVSSPACQHAFEAQNAELTSRCML